MKNIKKIFCKHIYMKIGFKEEIDKNIRYSKRLYKCKRCGKEKWVDGRKDMQVDYVESLYWYGGENDIENYLPACRACNFYKSTMGIEEFRNRLQTINQRLKKIFIYKIALKYGIVEENNKPIKFYFETLD